MYPSFNACFLAFCPTAPLKYNIESNTAGSYSRVCWCEGTMIQPLTDTILHYSIQEVKNENLWIALFCLSFSFHLLCLSSILHFLCFTNPISLFSTPSEDEWPPHLLLIKPLSHNSMQTIALHGPDVQIIKTYSLGTETSQVPIWDREWWT